VKEAIAEVIIVIKAFSNRSCFNSTSTSANRQFVWGLRYLDDLSLRDRDTTGGGPSMNGSTPCTITSMSRPWSTRVARFRRRLDIIPETQKVMRIEFLAIGLLSCLYSADCLAATLESVRETGPDGPAQARYFLQWRTEPRGEQLPVQIFRVSGETNWTLRIVNTDGAQDPNVRGRAVGKYAWTNIAAIIDGSLTWWTEKFPAQEIVLCGLDVSLSQELWQSVHDGIQHDMRHNGDKVRMNSPWLRDRCRIAVEKAISAHGVNKAFESHHMSIVWVQMWDEPPFRASLAGKPWKEVAEISGLGLKTPFICAIHLKPARAADQRRAR
jgi:hypothetical protein